MPSLDGFSVHVTCGGVRLDEYSTKIRKTDGFTASCWIPSEADKVMVNISLLNVRLLLLEVLYRIQLEHGREMSLQAFFKVRWCWYARLNREGHRWFAYS